MTTQKSYSKDNLSSHKNMGFKFFLFDLKRSWPKIVLYALVFMFFLPVMYLLLIPEPINFKDIECFSDSLLELISSSRSLWTSVSAFVAIFAGCIATKHLNQKITSDFYHSLPLRREELYILKYSVGVADYLISFVLNALAVLIIFETQPLAPTYAGLIATEIFKNIAFSLLIFFSVYSFTVFSGMLCGTTWMQLITLFYINFYAIVAFVAVVSTLDIFLKDLLTSYYFDVETILNIMPIGRMIACDSYLKPIHIWTFIIADVVIIMLSLALYKARKTERAGDPIIFKGYERIFRYSMLFVVAMLGGVFFHILIDKAAWVIFGVAMGAFISFLLLNTIISKNARKMFSGFKPFVFCCVIIAMVYGGLFINRDSLDGYVPKESNIVSVNVSVSESFDNVDFKDKDVIKAVIDIDKNYHRNDKENKSQIESSAVAVEIEDAKTKLSYHPQRSLVSITIIYKTKNGIDIAKDFNFAYDEFADVLFEAVARSEEYEEYFLKFADIYSFGHASNNFDVDGNILEIENDNEFFFEAMNYSGSAKDVYNRLTVDVNGRDIYDYYQNTNMMSVIFYGRYKYQYRTLVPLMADSKNIDLFLGYETIDEYKNVLVENIMSISVFRVDENMSGNDREILITDKNEIREIIDNVSSLCESVSNFTRIAPDYYIVIKTPNTEKETAVALSTSFLYGRVPDFIIDAFK